jgi:predicted TIM-barrel fold metal-dependent hydrolase
MNTSPNESRPVIIDAHCHAWQVWPYAPPVPDPLSRGLVEHLLWEMDANGVVEAVLVCARIAHNPDNNDYGADAVAHHPGRLHQFADFDCCWSEEYHTPGAPDRLRRLADRLPIKGITHYLGAANDGWLVSSEAATVFAVAAERRLILSLAAPIGWQEDVQRVARAYPELPILCHHLAGIREAPEGAEAALRLVLQGAALPNLMVKVSGFYYGDARPWDYPIVGAQWIVRALYETLGPRRLCWGSDYPVVRQHMTYRQSLEKLRTHCAFLPGADLDWVLGGTMQALLRTGRPGT